MLSDKLLIRGLETAHHKLSKPRNTGVNSTYYTSISKRAYIHPYHQTTCNCNEIKNEKIKLTVVLKYKTVYATFYIPV